MTNHWADLQNAKVFLIEGSNAAENHAMSMKWIRKAKDRGAIVIHVDPRFNRTSTVADVYARIRPGADRFQEISWDEALDRVAKKLKASRDANWIATEKVGDAENPVNRTDAIAFLGGAQNTNEECYLYNKLGRLLGTNYVEHQARL